MRTYFSFAFALSALCCWLYGYLYLYDFVSAPEELQIEATTSWSLFDAIAKLLICIALFLVVDRWYNLFMAFMVAICMNNLYDELWGNPFKLGLSEVVIFCLLSIYITLRMVMMYGKPK